MISCCKQARVQVASAYAVCKPVNQNFTILLQKKINLPQNITYFARKRQLASVGCCYFCYRSSFFSEQHENKEHMGFASIKTLFWQRNMFSTMIIHFAMYNNLLHSKSFFWYAKYLLQILRQLGKWCQTNLDLRSH